MSKEIKNENEILEEKKENNELEIKDEYKIIDLENGQYKFPVIEVYDKQDDLQEVEIVAQKMYNGLNYSKAMSEYDATNDIVKLAEKLLPSMIVEPVSVRKVEFFENDYDALNAVLVGLLRLQTKRKKKRTKPLKISF